MAPRGRPGFINPVDFDIEQDPRQPPGCHALGVSGTESVDPICRILPARNIAYSGASSAMPFREAQMSLLTSLAAWCRQAASPVRGPLHQRAAPDDLLTCLLAFSAVGLLASCLAFALEHDIPHVAVFEFVLICVAPPLAAMAGLMMLRGR
jgi:hypothetical protein